MTKHLSNLILLMILLLAAFIRLGGIGYLHFPDEAGQLQRSLEIGTGKFYPNFFVGVYSYLMFIWYSGFFAAGIVAGWWASLGDFMGVYYTDPHILYVAGRVAESLAGVGGIYCLYLLGQRLFSRTVGVAAALFLALNITHIQVSQMARGQSFALLFGLLALLFLDRFVRKCRLPDVFLAGMFLAGAFSIRVYYLAYLIPTGIFLLWNIGCRQFWKASLVLAISFVVFNVLFTPDWIFAPKLLLEGMSQSAVPLTPGNLMSGGRPMDVVAKPLWSYLSLLLPGSVGWPLYLLCWIGLLAAIPRIRELKFAVIAVLPIPFFLVMGNSRLAAPRYVLPAFPMLFLLAGFVLEKVVSHSAFLRRKSVWIPAAALLLVLPGIPGIVRWDIRQNRLQTIDIARDWIIQNIPDRARIAVESTGYSGPNIRLYSVIDYDIYRMSPDELRALYAERVKTDPSGSRALKYFIENPPKPWHRIYDLNVRKPVPLESLIEGEVEYFVVSSGVAEGYVAARTRERLPDLVANREAFYAWVEASCDLLKTFSPSDEHPGPEIRVYRLKKDRMK